LKKKAYEALKRGRVHADGWFTWKLVPIRVAVLNGINDIIFEFTVGIALVITDVPFVAFHQGSDLLQKYFFESSCKLHHYLQRKPIRQLHLKKGFMVTINMEVGGIAIFEDFEELPTDWAAAL